MDKKLSEEQAIQFNALVLPHLNAAYNLARWLTRSDHDAQDVVQAAFLRALKFFDGFQGGNAKAWLLTIVRNTFYSSLRDNQHDQENVDFDETMHSTNDHSSFPESVVENRDLNRIINQTLEKLPTSFREIVILKDIEELSYKEIADVVGIPVGTVMSRLARGRKMLSAHLKSAGVGESNGMQ